MTQRQLTLLENQIEDNLSDDGKEDLPLQNALTSYGAEFPVETLVKRMSRGDIFVPDFQRGFVWSLKQSSRFIESLLFSLPVPSIFLALDHNNKFLVIDGQQRLKTLGYFYNGQFADGKDFALKGVNEQLEGKTYQALSWDYQSKLDSRLLHAVIVKQDKPSDIDKIFQVFERLNTGGTELLPQEIRSAVYRGKFNATLKRLSMSAVWRAIYGETGSHPKDQELILRFFALYFKGNEYKPPMSQFLNHYMHENSRLDIKGQSEADLTKLFIDTLEVISKCLSDNVFKRNQILNAAVFDAVMIGVTRRLQRGEIKDCKALQVKYDSLLVDQAFSTATNHNTANAEFVRRRIRLATQAFANVE